MGQSGSTSQANQTTKTENIDKRLVNESGIALSAEGSTISINNKMESIDAEIAKAAFDFASGADAVSGEGFNKLLSLADKVITGGAELVTKSQDMSLSAMAAAQNDSKGAIDQKTMIMLSAAAVVAVVAMNGKK
jgi:hypothetical protein